MLDFEGVLLPREVLGLTRLTFMAERVNSVSSNEDEGASRQLGVPFLRLSLAEITDAEYAEWLKGVEPGPADAGPNKLAKSVVTTAPADKP